ncbi:hypothetical protein KBK19_07425 [Microvirga sp. STR05]|uniref:Lipoprotein n=1 Tax=Hymenobacter duratus TaxID=2771356 RepID=A0ABR8JDE9_9BACT|nr:hypothetical protein [Hymenobacter duratus]MBD2714861.1 hypothetical protein [Hymenobacter duratus]MBR7949766.1 hypothetical protein [Microvirga sp. STR05]
MKITVWIAFLLLVNSCRHAEVKEASKLDFYQQQELQALLDISDAVFGKPTFEIRLPFKSLMIYRKIGKTKHEWLADSAAYANDTYTASIVYIADSLLPFFPSSRFENHKCYSGIKNAISIASDSRQYDGDLQLQSSIVHPALVEKLRLRKRSFIHKDGNAIRATIKKNGHVLMVSRVIFNRTFSSGYIYTAVHCPGECGGGMVYRIEKQNGKWQVISSDATWIS